MYFQFRWCVYWIKILQHIFYTYLFPFITLLVFSFNLETYVKNVSFKFRYSSRKKCQNMRFLWYMCGALRDLLTFIQLKKSEIQPLTNVNFSKVAGFKLYKWYQIAQHITNFLVYDSVLIRENAGTILFIYGKIRIKESPNFRIFYAVIKKK